MKLNMKRLVLLAFAIMMAACAKDDTVIIFQVSDPQLGFTTRNQDTVYETNTFTKGVMAINAVKPDAVVLTGDLVHDCLDQSQWDEYKRIEGMLDESISIFRIPGNHDILHKEGLDLEPFVKEFGSDRFCGKIGNVRLVGMDTNIIKYASGGTEEKELIQWLTEALEGKGKGELSIVFGHHPFFLNAPDEEDDYFNIETEKRNSYLRIFEENKVDAVFCGHKHDNYEAADGTRPFITTSALGKPLGEAPSGVRVIVCSKGRISHSYFPVDEIPSSREEIIETCRNLPICQ